MLAIFNRRVLTRRYFIILGVLVVLAFIANYINFTTTNAFCLDGSGINCVLTNNYEFIRLTSFLMICVLMIYILYLAWIYDFKATEEETGEKTEEDVIESPMTEITVVEETEVATTEEVEPGFYLEVEQDSTSTGRIIKHENGILPKVLKEGNYWISINQEETEEVTVVDYSKLEMHKPGYRVTPGYYLEVDENFESVGRYIYQERKLPPTTKKGHWWAKVVDKGDDTNLKGSISFQDRETNSSKQDAEPGYYLEVEEDKTPTGRTINHQGGRLPEVLKQGNLWIQVEEQEKEEFVAIDYSTFEHFKPGRQVEPGYYLEVDVNYESIERYIYQAQKLPPTRKTGHSWVKVEYSKEQKEA